MNALQLLFYTRLFFFAIGCLLTTWLGILLTHRSVEHSNILWWLFCLEGFAMFYYLTVEVFLRSFNQGRLSLLGILGSGVATQGVINNAVDSELQWVLLLMAGCNLGFIFFSGIRLKPKRTPIHRKTLTNNSLETPNADGHASEFQSETPAIEDSETMDSESKSDVSSDTYSTFSDRSSCLPPELISLIVGIVGLSLGAVGWTINFALWIKECIDKETCKELGTQWWILSQSLLFFIMYILAMMMSRSFEILAPYCVMVAIPVSVYIYVANSARTDFFYILENKQSSYETWDSAGTVIGSSLVIICGLFLVISFGILHASWKSNAPRYTRTFRGLLSLFGLLGVVIFGIGLKASQDDACKHDKDLCSWYDELWIDIGMEILIVICSVFSAFSQPGESFRAILIALAVLPSFSFVVNISRFVENWNPNDHFQSPESTSDIRFSACGLIMLFVFNYLSIFAWGWGKSESSERQTTSEESRTTKTLTKTVRSFTGVKIKRLNSRDPDGVEMGQMNGHTC